jgi:hypothetical protein
LPNDVPESLKHFVARRAGRRCEYCLLHYQHSYLPHQIDHIVSRKHGGASDPPNLAYVCIRCNLWKGSDVASIDPATGQLVKLFHPRQHRWEDHFILRGAELEALTEQAAATIRLLKLNHPKRIEERRMLAEAGSNPE